MERYKIGPDSKWVIDWYKNSKKTLIVQILVGRYYPIVSIYIESKEKKNGKN